jgi:hypothetical protein
MDGGELEKREGSNGAGVMYCSSDGRWPMPPNSPWKPMRFGS